MKDKKQKIIFLDIDGVLCSARAHTAYAADSLERHLDPVATRLVARLCADSGAVLVLSSTWRKELDKEAMTIVLKNCGFSKVPWHSNWKTPDLSHKGAYGMEFTPQRGFEVEEWLKQSGGDCNYVILDDNSDFLPEQMPRLVLTSTDNGLMIEHYRKAREILKS